MLIVPQCAENFGEQAKLWATDGCYDIINSVDRASYRF